MRSKIGFDFLLITGVLACSCHLLLLLSLLILLVAGTALGLWLAAHTGLVIGLSTSYFIFVLVVGFRLVRRQQHSGTGSGSAEGRLRQAAPYGEHV